MNRRNFVKGMLSVSALAAAVPALKRAESQVGAAASPHSLEAWLLESGKRSLGGLFAMEVGTQIAQC